MPRLNIIVACLYVVCAHPGLDDIKIMIIINITITEYKPQ